LLKHLHALLFVLDILRPTLHAHRCHCLIKKTNKTGTYSLQHVNC